MNNITKRVSMYIRVKPEFEKDYDFKQVVIRIGYMEDPSFVTRPYSPRFAVTNFTVFLTEPDGTPHTYKHEVPIHEVWDYNRQTQSTPYAAREENIKKYIEKLPLYWKVLDRAIVIQSRLLCITQDMKFNAHNAPYRKYDAYANHKYMEVKTSLNIIAGFILDKEPRSLVVRNMETIEDIESIKVKVSDFEHTVIVDSNSDIEKDEEIAPEDVLAIKGLIETWKEQKRNLVSDNADNGVAIRKLAENLSYTRRLFDVASKDESNPNLTKIKAIIPEFWKVEDALEAIEQKYASLPADRDAEMMEYMGVVFGVLGKELERVLDMYVNPDKYSI